MRRAVDLWILTLKAPLAQAQSIAELFADESVSLTVLSPPRTSLATIEALFDHKPEIHEIHARLAVFAALRDIECPKPILGQAPNLDWLQKVAEDFPPLKIGRWTVHGAMHRSKVPIRQLALQIDATNAFGTGEHPTTRGCLLMLDKLLKNGFRPRLMADIGCGSGVLAMGCIKVTRGRAVAVDLDPDSVQIALNNLRVNGLGGKVAVKRGRGYANSLVRSLAPYDLIMANIFARPLSHMAKDLKMSLRPGGVAILSGLLTSQANMVLAAHRIQGLALIEHKKIGEWSVLALRRPQRA